MTKLKFWQQKQNAVKAQFDFNWLIPTVAAMIVPCYILATSVKSYAIPNRARIVRVGGLREVWVDQDGNRRRATDRMSLEKRAGALLVTGDGSSYANLRIGSDLATGGTDHPHNFRYTFPCLYGGRWTIGMRSGCQGILLKSRVGRTALLSRTKSNVNADYIMIQKATDQATVIQTNESADGSQLTVDVLAGTVTIKSRLKPGGISLSKGQRYTYSVNGQGDSTGTYAPNTDAVQIFLDPNNWEPSDANALQEYRNAINPPNNTPPNNTPPIR